MASRAHGAGLFGELRGVLHLPVRHEGVEGDVHLAAPDPAVAHGLGKFLVGKILGSAAGVIVPEAHIYGVGTVLYGGDDRFRRTRRR
jgi:hypothetical protein